MDYELEIDGQKVTLPSANLKPKIVVVEEPTPKIRRARKAKVARAPRRNPIVTAAVQTIPPLPQLPDGALIPTGFNEETIQAIQAFQQGQNQNNNLFPGILGGVIGLVGSALIGSIIKR